MKLWTKFRKRLRKHYWNWYNSKRSKPNQRPIPTENELWLEYYADYLHIWPFRELCSRLETNTVRGLTDDAARMKLARNGQNALPIKTKHTPYILKLARHCFSIYGVLLLLSAIACFILFIWLKKNSTDGCFEYLATSCILFFTFVLYGYLQKLQEIDTEPLVTAFEDLVPRYCTVIRDGEKEIILTEKVVMGDIVPISYGQRLPADLRFFNCFGLEVNNVALTGYTDPFQIIPLSIDGRQSRYSTQIY
ncbi:sodium/potassium-transporting ATPase subunit alpha-A [Drosophila bipectinata]|uniref:sodium/potassium-transporting ATPase subunit alpha-A n=1 Tax=Drosophila bipectinata TaxID=42026 RepID=UPI001C8ABDC8|nr:sodium/potassium-transporting ATPase subunit alpha-A [Drosophila bipectinata]